MLGFTTLEAAKQAWQVNVFGCQDNDGEGNNNTVLLIFIRREGRKERKERKTSTK